MPVELDEVAIIAVRFLEVLATIEKRCRLVAMYSAGLWCNSGFMMKLLSLLSHLPITSDPCSLLR